MPLRGHLRLVEEDPAEVVAVGEHLVLQRQEGAAGVDEIEARQPVLRGDLLRAQVLLHGQRVVRAALDGRVVRDDHALRALDDADARDDAGARRVAVVEIPGGERVQLEEGRVGVDEPVDALARRQLAARAVPLDGLLAAAARDGSVRSRSSATSAAMRSWRRENSSEPRSTCDVRTATAGAYRGRPTPGLA